MQNLLRKGVDFSTPSSKPTGSKACACGARISANKAFCLNCLAYAVQGDLKAMGKYRDLEAIKNDIKSGVAQ